MYHTAAYSASIALTSTNQPVAAINDNVFRVGASNGFVLQEDMMLLAAQAGGTGLANPKLTSPKLAQFSPLFIAPFQTAAAWADGMLAAQWPYRAFTFRNQEEVTAFADNGNAGAQQETIVVYFSNGVEQIPAGEELVLRATSSTAAVAFAWTLVNYTLAQALPEGVYVMVASEVVSTNAVAHRWTFWNQFYRPGMPSSTAFANRQFPGVYWFTLGAMGQFSNVTLPNLEVLAGAADASHTVNIRCIKVK